MAMNIRNMQQVAKHIGKVNGIRPGAVSVVIESISACAACEAHSKCGFSESKEKQMEIETPLWNEYQEGDTVEVQINQGLGLMAVLWAYLLPAILLLASLMLTLLNGMGEGLSILIAFGVLLIYLIILYANRHRLQRRFSFQIEKI